VFVPVVILSFVGFDSVRLPLFAFVFRLGLPDVLSRPGFDKKVTSDVTAKIRVLLWRTVTGLRLDADALFVSKTETGARHSARR